MLIRLTLFTNPLYDAERHLEIDPLDVVSVEQKHISALLRGKHWVTEVTLKNGNKHILEGAVAGEVELAQRQAKEQELLK